MNHQVVTNQPLWKRTEERCRTSAFAFWIGLHRCVKLHFELTLLCRLPALNNQKHDAHVVCRDSVEFAQPRLPQENWSFVRGKRGCVLLVNDGRNALSDYRHIFRKTNNFTRKDRSYHATIIKSLTQSGPSAISYLYIECSIVPTVERFELHVCRPGHVPHSFRWTQSQTQTTGHQYCFYALTNKNWCYRFLAGGRIRGGVSQRWVRLSRSV